MQEHHGARVEEAVYRAHTAVDEFADSLFPAKPLPLEEIARLYVLADDLDLWS